MFRYGPSPANYSPYGGPYPNDGYAAERNRPAGFNQLLQHGGPVTTTQVTIPTEMAGKR
jgi:hypothetical protein